MRELATLTHARVDSGVCHTPGLFKSLSPGEREGSKLNVKYTPREGGASYQFVGPEPLGTDDLRVFQGLVAAAAIMQEHQWATVQHDSQSERGIALRSGLEKKLALLEDGTEAQSDKDAALMVNVSYARLATEIGYANTRDKSAIRDSIKRLFSVTTFKTEDGYTVGSKLIADYKAKDATEEICIALNPVLAAAVLGTDGGNALRVNLTEARLLKSPAARLLQWRLSFINEGATRQVGLTRLCEYAYPPTAPDELKRRAGVEAVKAADKRRRLLALAGGADAEAAAKARADLATLDRALTNPKQEKYRLDNTQKKHERIVREALNELRALGWCITEARNIFKISRPQRSVTLALVPAEET